MNVYFIKTRDNAQLVKVGKAKDVQTRLAALQTGSAVGLELVGNILCESDKAAYELEKHIHENFYNLRARGEWFRYSANLRNFIQGCEQKDPEKVLRALEKNKQVVKKKSSSFVNLPTGHRINRKDLYRQAAESVGMYASAGPKAIAAVGRSQGYKGSKDQVLMQMAGYTML